MGNQIVLNKSQFESDFTTMDHRSTSKVSASNRPHSPPNVEAESSRASENFRGCLPQYPPKNLGQILAALAISGIFERFSPGQSGSEVGGPIYINSPTGPPTWGPFGRGENRSKTPEIARAARIWPKFFGGY